MALFLRHIGRKFLCLQKRENFFVSNMGLFGKKKPKTNEMCNYKFEHPDKKDFNQIYRLMEEFYFPEEPTMKSIEFGNKYNPVLEKEVYETLEQGYSLVAKCVWTGCIVGACLNMAICEHYPEELKSYACKVKDEKTKQLLLFYSYLQEAPDLFDKYCAEQLFVIRAIVMDGDNRYLRVASKLVELSRQLGKDLRFSIVRVDCTHVALSSICEKFGMKREYELKYCDYIGEDLKPVFEPLPPNTSVVTYIDLPHRKK